MSLTKKYQMARMTLAMAETIVVMTCESTRVSGDVGCEEGEAKGGGGGTHVDDGHEDGVDASSDGADDVTHCGRRCGSL